MKLNINKLRQVERDYSDYNLCLNTIQTMVNIVVQSDSNELGLKLGGNYNLALDTLKELGILEDSNPKVQQLNS